MGVGENGERGEHRAGWAGVSGSGRRQSGGCVLQTRVKKQARGRPGLPEEGRALEGGLAVSGTRATTEAGFLRSKHTHTLCMFSRTGTSLGAGDTGNSVCSQKTLTTHEFACVALQLDTCNGSS